MNETRSTRKLRIISLVRDESLVRVCAIPTTAARAELRNHDASDQTSSACRVRTSWERKDSCPLLKPRYSITTLLTRPLRPAEYELLLSTERFAQRFVSSSTDKKIGNLNSVAKDDKAR
mmetsp:Transcript_8927/g.13062  ORF Transcript_8927/g.13062 Transcript_8927/m.13062 type:complete len:119 (-) Transcript_8927:980-1336(-)